MPNDDEMVMLSALQHYLFCPRQCALIHVEGVWSENYLTTAGKRMHERVDSGRKETRRGVHTATSLRLASKRLNLTGVADSVEFHLDESEFDDSGIRRACKLHDRDGWWRVFPVEYKHGAPKSYRADEVQLCAQAICLEEMFGVRIDSGALFYGETRRRIEVSFDDELRSLVESTAKEVSELIKSGVTPLRTKTKSCEACSLKGYCLDDDGSAREWINKEISAVMQRGVND